MPDKKLTLEAWNLYRDGATARRISEDCNISYDVAKKLVAFFELTGEGASETEISNKKLWVLKTTRKMTRWVTDDERDLSGIPDEGHGEIEGEVSIPVSTEEDEIVISAREKHVDGLVSFASEISESLEVPTPTAVSGIEQERWDGPYSGVQDSLPSIRALAAGDGSDHYKALQAHLPGIGVARAIASVRSSLKVYAQSAHTLADLVQRLYSARGVGGKTGLVPRGVILATLHFGVEAAGPGTSTGVVPIVERRPDGGADIRIGGWSASFTDTELADTAKSVFADSLRKVSESKEVRSLLDAKANCDASIKKVSRLLSPGDKIRIAISRSSCAACAVAG